MPLFEKFKGSSKNHLVAAAISREIKFISCAINSPLVVLDFCKVRIAVSLVVPNRKSSFSIV